MISRVEKVFGDEEIRERERRQNLGVVDTPAVSILGFESLENNNFSPK